MHHLSVNGLSKSFGNKHILDSIDLECRTGEIVGIFGRNGTGKSTILRIILGVVKANSLQLSIDQVNMAAKDIIVKRKTAYLPQESCLPQSLKVRDVVPLYFNDGTAQDKVFYAPGIAKIENTKIGSLSMGQKRYLELLLISNLDHPFLMLDEPFSMIEPLYKDLIKDLLLGLKATKGIIVTDHYYNDVFSITTRNLLLHNKTLITINNEQDLFKYGYIPASNS